MQHHDVRSPRLIIQLLLLGLATASGHQISFPQQSSHSVEVRELSPSRSSFSPVLPGPVLPGSDAGLFSATNGQHDEKLFGGAETVPVRGSQAVLRGSLDCDVNRASEEPRAKSRCSSVVGCTRLRGGGKRRCHHPGCRQQYMAIAGDCQYCPKKFCSTHRLPEDHQCTNLVTCRAEAFNANSVRLADEARGVHARPESMVRETE
mmetsp:Transcript_22455/g.45921  ORF Transcript_22455/g.45921 Transcript_22455/m.45921 type:complete len:205 (+) Transcript_22455:252-866(+)|eukprot:CAMPEP_0196718766 /NCGR_PEP_ID=MMETSP1091-20130531/1883_1 /TAXON_ID=302021 /ORGANISM="Rhodomonas sp., Strain CCMP768" /LENGTH=204 /DNA_ID=CAMNT_0042059503 /DNA_START=261 /DNA_END=875 /DNA_ORIENTATION=-